MKRHRWLAAGILIEVLAWGTGAQAASVPRAAARAAAPAAADDDGNHTITWWCVDLSRLWHTGVPAIVGVGFLTPPVPNPIPPCDTTSTFPIQVPAGSGWTGGGAAIWYANTHYTPQVAQALEAMGYDFESANPVEDFRRKLTVRYIVLSLPSNQTVAEYTFDPRHDFRLVRFRDFYGDLASTAEPIVIPELGIDLTAEAVTRLPLFHVPGVADPLPPGRYRVQVFWDLSALHNDGLGLDPGNFVPAGSNLIAQPIFDVVP